MRRFYTALFALLIILSAPLRSFAAADDISRLYNFTSGTTIQSSQVNGEFNQLITTMNGKFGRSVANTVTGANTFSGLNTFSNITTFSEPTTGIKTDKISEYTSANGISIDSVLMKDGYLKVSPTTQPYVPTAAGEFGLDTTNSLYKGYIGSAVVPFVTDNGVNAQTGTTYTVLATDRNKLVTFSNGSSIAVTLPQAGSTGFANNYKATFVNLGAGTVTITPTTSTIDGAATITLTQNQGITVFSDNTNYFTNRGRTTAPAASSGASLTLISSATASSSATIDFTSGISSTYDTYLIVFSNVVPATNQTILESRVSENAGSSWVSSASAYNYGVNGNNGGSAATTNSTTATEMQMSLNGGATQQLVNTEPFSGSMWFFNPSGSSNHKNFTWTVTGVNGNGTHNVVGGGLYKSTTNAINGVRFFMNSGNIASGTFYLYGVAKQ